MKVNLWAIHSPLLIPPAMPTQSYKHISPDHFLVILDESFGESRFAIAANDEEWSAFIKTTTPGHFRFGEHWQGLKHNTR